MKQLVRPHDQQHSTAPTPVDARRPSPVPSAPTAASTSKRTCRMRPGPPARDTQTCGSAVHTATQRTHKLQHSAHAVSSEHIETLQLQRLAQALLTKDHHDLSALTASNPKLVREWQRAFQAQRQEAEKCARFWASAAAQLKAAQGLTGVPCKKTSTH